MAWELNNGAMRSYPGSSVPEVLQHASEEIARARHAGESHSARACRVDLSKALRDTRDCSENLLAELCAGHECLNPSHDQRREACR